MPEMAIRKQKSYCMCRQVSSKTRYKDRERERGVCLYMEIDYTSDSA